MANTKPKNSDLAFLLLVPKKEPKMNLDKAKKLINLIRAKNKIQYKDLANRLKVSEILIRQFITELRKAAEKGMSLEEYFQKGRPFNGKNKKLA